MEAVELHKTANNVWMKRRDNADPSIRGVIDEKLSECARFEVFKPKYQNWFYDKQQEIWKRYSY